MKLKMNDTVVDENGTQLTKPRAQKLAKDHVMKQVEEGFEMNDTQVVPISFGALMDDSEDVTLGDVMGRYVK